MNDYNKYEYNSIMLKKYENIFLHVGFAIISELGYILVLPLLVSYNFILGSL